MNIVPGGSRVMRPPTAADGWLTLTLTRRDDVVTGGSETTYVDNDSVMKSTVGATTDTAWDVDALANHFGHIAQVSLSCTGAGLLTGNRLTRIADGQCNVIASSGLLLTSQVVDVVRYNPPVYREWQSWVAGSLAAALEDTTDVALPFWSGGGFGFTAISPRHVIGCEHIYYMPQSLTLGGVTRNLISTEYIGPDNVSDSFATDLLIGKYDGDFPSFAKIFPPTLYDYLPSLRYHPDPGIKDVPAFVCNQFGERLRRTSGVIQPELHRFGLRAYGLETDPNYKDIIGGDSGNPAFLVLDGEPILLGTLTGGGAGGLTTVHDLATTQTRHRRIDGGGYQLTQIDLSGYPSYA